MKLHDTSLKEGSQTPFPCPKCGAPLVVKKNNSTDEAFLGCGLYRETQCKGGYPLKREHITQILVHNNEESKVATPAVKSPEASLPSDSPPPVSEFGGTGVKATMEEFELGGALTTFPQEITIKLEFDAVFQASLFAFLEKILAHSKNGG